VFFNEYPRRKRGINVIFRHNERCLWHNLSIALPEESGIGNRPMMDYSLHAFKNPRLSQ